MSYDIVLFSFSSFTGFPHTKSFSGNAAFFTVYATVKKKIQNAFAFDSFSALLVEVKELLYFSFLEKISFMVF